MATKHLPIFLFLTGGVYLVILSLSHHCKFYVEAEEGNFFFFFLAYRLLYNENHIQKWRGHSEILDLELVSVQIGSLGCLPGEGVRMFYV